MMRRYLAALLFLLLISLAGAAVAADEYWEYTFRPGDSIWKIAKKYTTSVNNWKEIQQLNQIRQGPDRRIQPGTRIIIPVTMLKVQPNPARVIAFSGAVSLVRANGEKAGVEIGTLLYSGDRVVTVENQLVRIQFADNSELQVLPRSEIILDKLSQHKTTGMVDTRIRLNSGRVNTQVEKQQKGGRYEIKSPTAITAVRGTAFRLASSSLISRTEVTEGIVSVSAGDMEKAVREGYGIVAEKGKPLSDPIKLLPPPTLSKSLSSDNTLMQVSWLKIKGAMLYRYQLASDDKFNQLAMDKLTDKTSVNFGALEPGHYFMKVRAIDQYRLQGVDALSEFMIQQAPAQDDTLRNILLPAEILFLNQ